MLQPAQLTTSKKVALGIFGLIAACGLGVLATPARTIHMDASHNLFALIANLGGTTTDMLHNTQSLHQQVANVQSQLNQLNTESAILNQQLQTGQQLTAALQTQKSLTQQGVSLMQQILVRQQETEALTSQVSSKANHLAGTVHQNASELGSLTSRMQTALGESAHLNQQMDTLLQELSVSTDEFKFFGRVDRLLSGLVPGGSSGGGLLGSGIGAGLPSTGSASGSGSGLSNTVGSIINNLP